MTEEPPTPLDVALDVFFYAPVGLAITAAEELPKLAEKGRSRVGAQIGMARVVGRFAVSRGRQTFEKRFTPPPYPGPPTGFETGPRRDSDPEVTLPADPAGDQVPAGTGPASAPTARDLGAGPPPPEAAELAIPGYDSLSASQVVQRLAGLSRSELASVGDYERAHRGRRTILNRIDQLQGQ
ncbi:MAG: hypothetical protein KGQ66_10410 [Acidobacteriota bacterium]|nr:hypothetical protein [Acidobacteriota bacterium]